MLKFENVSLKFVKDYYALCNVTFNFEESKIYNIVGKTASGKSSLLRCVSKLEEYEGDISYNNIDIKKYDYSKELNIGYLPQIPVLLEKKDVVDNLKYAVENRQIVSTSEEDYYVNQVVKYFELDGIKNIKAKNLEYYQKQMVAMARLSMRKLDVLLIDNIFELLNEKEIEQIATYIKDLFVNEHTIIIFASNENLSKYFDSATVVNIDAGMIKNN